MSSSEIRDLILVAVLVLVNGFFAAAEIAVVTVNKLRLRQLIDQGNRTARLVDRLAADSSRFLATIQVGITLVGFLAAAIGARDLANHFGGLLAQIRVGFIQAYANSIAVALITVLLALIMLLFGELVPKAIALQYAERIAFAVARPIDWLERIFRPIVGALVFLSNGIARLFGVHQRSNLPFVTEEEIKAMVDAGEEGGALESEEKEMIYSIFEFGETVAREVMVPRIDMVAVEANTPLLQALDVIVKEGFSRIPVFDETIDDIIGLLYAKDLLVYLKEGKHDVDLKSILRPAYFVPETKKVDDLLKELQQRRVHMAIVVDEYGGTSGLVTVEDLVEEIVGEIRDEYDVEEPTMERISENECIFDARVPLDEVDDCMKVEMPEGISDTLGGFIYSQLGRVAAVGDRVEFGGLSFTVLSVSGRRIRKVRVIHADLPVAETAPEDTKSTMENSNDER